MNLKLGMQVARALGVSPGKARQLAQSDPEFPPILDFGPRARFVDEEALLRYRAAKVRVQQIGTGVKS